MYSKNFELIQEKFKNLWLLQCASGVRPATKKQVDATWCLEHGADVNTTDNLGNTPLHIAANRGDAALVDLLLNYVAGVNIPNNFKKTPLHCAVENGYTQIATLLLYSGADVNATDDYGDTPLNLALCSGDATLVHLLLNSKADVNKSFRNGDPLLHWATRRGDVSLVSKLLNYGAGIDTKNSDGDTPLHEAVNCRDATVADKLMIAGANVNATTVNGYTALHLAVCSGNTFLLEQLLKYGANVKITNKVGNLPLHTAVADGKESIVDLLLLNSRSDVNTINKAGDTPLHIAVRYNKEVSLVKILLKYGADVKIKNKNGTPLHVAASYGDASIVELLVISGAEVDQMNWNGSTPLHCAVEHMNVSTVDQLLKCEALVNAKTIYGDTPLLVAATCGDASIADRLLKHGADLTIVNRHGKMPLHVAINNANAAFVKVLVNNGADVRILDRNGNVPLHMAIRSRDVALTEVLLEYGAEFNIKNIDGDAPLHVAATYGPAAIVKVLLKYGADLNTKDTRHEDTPLHLAVRYKDSSMVDLLHKYDADINIMNRGGETPLHEAVRHKDAHIVEQLLKLYGKVNIVDGNGNNPLHLAVITGYIPILEMLLEHGANVNSINKAGNTPLHLAARRRFLYTTELLLRRGADVTLRNMFSDTPLTVARIFNFDSYEEIVKQLQTAERLAKDNHLLRQDRSQSHYLCFNTPNIFLQNAEPGFKYSKRSGTSAVSGQLYETKLLCLVLIRALNDKQIEHFLIGTKICGIVDMDDICMRYEIRGQKRPIVMFVQAKHKDDRETARLTVADVLSDSGNFSLRKNFLSYLTIQSRFQVNNEDSMFEGDFANVECNFIIYTAVKDCFTKKITKHNVSNKVHNLIITGQNTEVFQYNHDEDDIDYLSQISALEHLTKFGIVFLELIYTEEDISDKILVNKLIMRHHVVMGQQVLQLCEIQPENKEYRNWKFRPEFFESNCEYLLALKSTFFKELSTKLYDKSEVTIEDQENFKLMLRDPCADTISKLIGKFVTYDDKCKHLELAEVLAFKEIIEKEEALKTLLEQFTKKCVLENVVHEAVRKKLTALEKIELPLAFGNLDMIIRGNKSEVEMRIKTLSKRLIHILEVSKNTKIVDINDDLVEPGKNINAGIMTIDDGIGSAVGNLLVIDTNTNMWKFDLDNKELPNNAALFLKELKDDMYKPINKELSSYRIKINIDETPKNSFKADEFDKKQARDFLSKLWFYTNQANQSQVECILKNQINNYYNYENDENSFLFIIHSHAIFLRSHDEIQKWWMQKGETFYLSKASDVFGSAKLACLKNLLLTVIDYMHYFNISCIDFKFNQHINQNNAGVSGTFNKIFGELFDIFDTQNKSININIDNKQQIVKLLQTAERLARDNVSPNRKPTEEPCSSKNEQIPHDSQNNAQPKFTYFKRDGTSGVRGQLYETKLLCLVLIRALNDEQIEHFLLGTNIRGIGDMDDICLQYRVRGQDRPVMLFVQAKHKDNPEKKELTVEDLRNDSGDFNLRKYFDAHVLLKEQFQVNNEDPLFEGEFDDIECYLIIYTPVKSCFTKKTTAWNVSEKVHYLVNTGQDTEVFQYDYDEDDIHDLTKMITLDRINKLGKNFLELIITQKCKSDLIMVNKLIKRHHVVMGRKVLQHCEKLENNNKEYRKWKFRPDFFDNDCEYIVALKSTLIKELSTKRYDNSDVNDEDQQNYKLMLQNPCPDTISKLIGKFVTYNDKKQFQIAEVTAFKEIIENENKYKTLLEQFIQKIYPENVVYETVKKKLIALENIELPLTFGNVDMSFRGNKEKKIKNYADKLIDLLKRNKDYIVHINDVDVGPGKSIERGFIINGGIATAVGNLLIFDENTEMLKFDLENKLENYAASFLAQLQDTRHNPVNEKLSSYRFKINVDGFPKSSFNGDEYDKKQAREFLSKLWFYTNQAKENEVEQILKDEINKYYTNQIDQNCNIQRNISDPVFLTSHDEMQKWWMQIDKSPYLSRMSELFEYAELAEIDNLLLTVINYMYISGVYSIDINIKQRVTDYSKFVKMHRTFNKMSGRLFGIFDSEFNALTDIKLPTETARFSEGSSFHCELVFSLEIHPALEWVALKLLVKGGISYSVIAKAGPGNGQRQAKDGFLLKQSFDDYPIYFINGEKNPLESLWRW